MSKVADAVRLAEIGVRCERATEGPWTTRMTPDRGSYIVHGPEGTGMVWHWDDGRCGFVFGADADFIAHAREDVPWLLEQLEEALGRKGGNS